MELMMDLIKMGHKVIAVGHDNGNDWYEKFKREGIEYMHVPVARNGINPLQDLRTYIRLKKLFKTVRPDKIFVYQAKTIIYGAIAAKRSGISEVYALMAGLGSVYRGKGFVNSLVKFIMNLQYKVAFRFCQKVFFQNHDDLNEFVNQKLLAEDRTVIINGSGVNIEKFTPQPLPDKPGFIFIGRLIRDKGVIEFLEACRIVKEEYPDIKCIVVGPFDSNPSALKENELQEYTAAGVVEYAGEQSDVRPFLNRSTTLVLPSYHEGTPKSVLEAMAMGCAVIASEVGAIPEILNISGDKPCGICIKPRNTHELRNALSYLMSDYEKINSLGNNGTTRVLTNYTMSIIGKEYEKAWHMAVYNRYDIKPTSRV